MVQIKGQYTLADFQKAQQLHARQGAASANTRSFFILASVLFYASMIILVLLGHMHWLYLLAPLALLAVLLLFQYLYRPFALERTFRNHPALSEPFEWELSDQGMSISNPRGNALVAWGTFVKWVEGKDTLLLYRSHNTFQMVPKRLFGSQDDLQYLRNQLARNEVPESRKTNKRVPLIWYIILFAVIITLLYLNLK
jgi:hypothetical protein